MKILAIDPSGSFKEGKGQTGWVILDGTKPIVFGMLKAKDFETKYDYWASHSELFKSTKPDYVVMEQYRLYSHKAKSQINSEMETSKLLGYLEMSLHSLEIQHTLQSAASAKSRFNDDILIYKGYITKDNNGRYYINGVNVAGHIIDALRHALYFELRLRRGKII